MARQKRKKWQVYFEGERPSRRRAPGREMPIGKQFVWGGRRWQIPAVYRCAEGLVLELVMQAPAGEIRAFMDRWGLGPASEPGDFDREQQMRIDSENPLTFSFTPVLLVDGRSLGNYRGHSRCWNPVPGGRDPADLPMLTQYGLDPPASPARCSQEQRPSRRSVRSAKRTSAATPPRSISNCPKSWNGGWCSGTFPVRTCRSSCADP